MGGHKGGIPGLRTHFYFSSGGILYCGRAAVAMVALTITKTGGKRHVKGGKRHVKNIKAAVGLRMPQPCQTNAIKVLAFAPNNRY